jgi:YHS domain-containing protein
VDHEGYRIFLCCSGCPERFLADPKPYMEKLERMGAFPAAGAKPAVDPRFQAPEGLIPIVPKECPVLGGEPVPDVYVDYQGYRIFLCCAGCPETFLADPKPFIEKLQAEGFEIDVDD